MHIPSAAIAITMWASMVSAQSLAFPFKAEDLPSGVRIATRPHNAGIQALGHDFTARRYVGDGKWSGRKVGQSGTNASAVIYGLPFYAMSDGEVIGCWRNAPEIRRAAAIRSVQLDGSLVGATISGSVIATATSRSTRTQSLDPFLHPCARTMPHWCPSKAEDPWVIQMSMPACTFHPVSRRPLPPAIMWSVRGCGVGSS